MVKILRTLGDKADSMQDHMDSVSREKKIFRKNFLKMLETLSNVTEMKIAFHGLTG